MGVQWLEALQITPDWDDPETKKGETTGAQELLKEATKYYEWLFSDKPSSEDGKLMASLRQHTLTKEEAAKCEGDLTASEVFAVMKNLPRNKATGPDGLPNEYYKTFATLEVTELTKVYNEAHNIGHLSAEMRQGNISLLYKKRNVTTLETIAPLRS